MKNVLSAAAIAITIAASPAFAQTTAPKAPPAPVTPSTSSATMDSATEAKFKAADKDGNGMLSGNEAQAYKADMTKIDTNKDGNISRDEFASAAKSGVIK